MFQIELLALAAVVGWAIGLGALAAWDAIRPAITAWQQARRWKATQAEIRAGRFQLPAYFTPEMIAVVQQFGAAGISWKDAVRLLTLPEDTDAT